MKRVILGASIVIGVIGVIGALTAGTRTAAAECAPPRNRISPVAGATLPLDPTVYIFFAEGRWSGERLHLTARQGRTPVAFDLEEVDRVPAWTVYRVAMRGTHPGALELHWDTTEPSWDEGGAIYDLSRFAPLDHAELLAAQSVRDFWTCSYSFGVALSTRGNAAAYRLDWRDRDDVLRHAFLPATPVASGGQIATEGGTNVFIGHASCTGMVVPLDAFHDATPVELTALYADGLAASIPIGMLRIDNARRLVSIPEDFRFGARLDPRDAQARVMRQSWNDLPSDQAPSASPKVTAPSSSLWPALVASGAAGAASMALTVALFARLTRRRRRARRAPLGQLAE